MATSKSKAQQNRQIKGSEQTVAETRVRYIVGLMIRGQWSHRAAYETAKKWNLSASRVRDISSEASRTMRLLLSEDLADTKAQILSGISEVMRLAGASKQYNVVLRALETQAKMLGLFEPQRIELSGGLDQMTDEQLDVKRQALIEKILAEQKALTQ